MRIVEPLGYFDTISLIDTARLVLTDSGGMQEETTALRVPCITLRENTERPITVEMGSSRLVGSRYEAIVAAVDAIARRSAADRHSSRNLGRQSG